MIVLRTNYISTAKLRMVQRAGGYHLMVEDNRQPSVTGIAHLSADRAHAERKYSYVIERETAKLAAESDGAR